MVENFVLTLERKQIFFFLQICLSEDFTPGFDGLGLPIFVEHSVTNGILKSGGW